MLNTMDDINIDMNSYYNNKTLLNDNINTNISDELINKIEFTGKDNNINSSNAKSNKSQTKNYEKQQQYTIKDINDVFKNIELPNAEVINDNGIQFVADKIVDNMVKAIYEGKIHVLLQSIGINRHLNIDKCNSLLTDKGIRIYISNNNAVAVLEQFKLFEASLSEEIQTNLYSERIIKYNNLIQSSMDYITQCANKYEIAIIDLQEGIQEQTILTRVNIIVPIYTVEEINCIATWLKEKGFGINIVTSPSEGNKLYVY